MDLKLVLFIVDEIGLNTKEWNLLFSTVHFEGDSDDGSGQGKHPNTTHWFGSVMEPQFI